MLCFFAAKGGAGCSVVAASTALLAARSGRALVVDLHGDLPSVLGVDDDDRPGLADWFRADSTMPDSLIRLETSVTDDLSLLPLRGRRTVATPDRFRMLTSLLVADNRTVIIDVGTLAIPAVALLAASSRSVLVTRACYLALRAARSGPEPDDVVLVSEPGRALRRRDIESVLAAPVTVTVPWDPATARAVDAGLLAARLPRSLRRLDSLL